MLRPSEAARVMEISLGKLANIRSQRVSSSLHKNLLVARVFNQVRTIVTVDETLPVDVVDGVDREKCALNSEFVDSSSGNSCPVPLMNEQYPNYGPDVDAEQQQPYNIGAHGSADSRVSDFKTVALSALCSDGESKMVFVDDNDDSDYSADTNRGSKRRSECDEVDCVSRKRLRSQSQSPSADWRSPVQVSDFDEDSSADMDSCDASMAYDNMMMVETEQISSLVTVFSTSFKGLGHLEGSVDDQVLSPRSPNSENNEQHFTTLSAGSPLRRGMSLPDLCAKQAELLCQKFQQNPPVVALTV